MKRVLKYSFLFRLGVSSLLAGGTWAGVALGANNLNNHGGSTMQNQLKGFLIYWLPSGVVLDTSVANGTGNFETLTQQFYTDLSATPYLNITTQYPGQCGSSECVVQNGTGAAKLGGTFVDSQAYPSGKGTTAKPLQDSDIQAEVQRAINQNHWTVDENSEFFVITGVFKSSGAGVVECFGSNGCTTPGGFCAYHSNFGLNGQTVLYGFLSDANFNTAGCGEGLGGAAPNGQADSDREVAMMSHELFETITDPQGNTWWDSSTGNEIGDNCNQIGAKIAMNGNNFWVQQQWSNASSSCVSVFGPSIRLTIGTGGDDLRGDSSATAALQKPGGATFETVTLKTQNQPSWSNNTGHIVVGNFNQASQTALGQIGVTLTSHNSFPETDDNWNIQNLTATVLSPTGGVLCTQSLSGNPLARLTGSAPTGTFLTPNCQPPIPPAAKFNQLSFNIVTGGDDLRGDSSATATVSLPGGSQTFTLKAQSDGGWENNSDHVKTFTIGGAAQPISGFGAITITLTSHNGFLETDDNWNIQTIEVTAEGSSGESCVLNQGGNPLARLTGSGPSVTLHPRNGC